LDVTHAEFSFEGGQNSDNPYYGTASQKMSVCVLTRVAQIVTDTQTCNPAWGSGHLDFPSPFATNLCTILDWPKLHILLRLVSEITYYAGR